MYQEQISKIVQNYTRELVHIIFSEISKVERAVSHEPPDLQSLILTQELGRVTRIRQVDSATPPEGDQQSDTAQKEALTRKRKEAARKAVATKKRMEKENGPRFTPEELSEIAKKAARTRKRRASARKAAETRARNASSP